MRHETGVRYVLQGLVHRSGNRIWIPVQLIDADTLRCIWAGCFETGQDVVSGGKDDPGDKICNAVIAYLRSGQHRHAEQPRTNGLDARDCVRLALPEAWMLDAGANGEALDLLQRALELDPEHPQAAALAAWCHAQRAVYLWAPQPAEERARAMQLAALAGRRCGSEDPDVLTALGAAYTLARDFGRASHLLGRATARHPGSARAWSRGGWLNLFLGRPELAIEHFRRALRLDPHDPTAFNTSIGVGCAHFKAGRYGECTEWVKEGLLERPSAVWAYRVLGAAYGQLDRLDEARHAVDILLESHPDVTISHIVELIPGGDPDYNARFAEGLRAAGLPE
jgi:adenylate cyclase